MVMYTTPPCRAAVRLNSGVRPVTNFRATYDQKIIDSWSAQLTARKQGIGKVLIGLGIALLVTLALLFIIKAKVLVLGVFGISFALIIAMLIDRGRLLCPNCNQPPLTTFERGPAASADFCPHCYYWLRPPYGTGHR